DLPADQTYHPADRAAGEAESGSISRRGKGERYGADPATGCPTGEPAGTGPGGAFGIDGEILCYPDAGTAHEGRPGTAESAATDAATEGIRWAGEIACLWQPLAS